MNSKISKIEENIITKQLGRKANNIIEVVKKCPFNYPAVLLAAPYRDKRPFPTIYWLSCPYLLKEVSRIEDQGKIQELTSKLEKEQSFKVGVEQAHENYAEQRKEMLTPELRLKIAEHSSAILEVLEKSGVGGIQEREGIKCLHTHLAHYMAQGQNPVGELVSSELSWPDACQICDKLVSEEEE